MRLVFSNEREKINTNKRGIRSYVRFIHFLEHRVVLVDQFLHHIEVVPQPIFLYTGIFHYGGELEAQLLHQLSLPEKRKNRSTPLPFPRSIGDLPRE